MRDAGQGGIEARRCCGSALQGPLFSHMFLNAPDPGPSCYRRQDASPHPLHNRRIPSRTHGSQTGVAQHDCPLHAYSMPTPSHPFWFHSTRGAPAGPATQQQGTSSPHQPWWQDPRDLAGWARGMPRGTHRLPSLGDESDDDSPLEVTFATLASGDADVMMFGSRAFGSGVHGVGASVLPPPC